MKITLYVILGILIFYWSALGLLYVFQRSFLYFPFTTEVNPARIGLSEARVIRVKTIDDQSIINWFIQKPGKFIVLYFHGNGNSLGDRPEILSQIADMGLSVLAVDYRGYGGSTGKPSETGLHRDADATYDQALELGFAPDHIILLGESLGSGVALELASRRQVAGVMLDSPYTSIVEVAARRFWMFPVRWLLRDTYRSDIWIRAVHMPILILHGVNDRVVPFDLGQRLSEIGGAHVRFVPIAGTAHLAFGTPEADVAARQWLSQFHL